MRLLDDVVYKYQEKKAKLEKKSKHGLNHKESIEYRMICDFLKDISHIGENWGDWK